MGSQADLIAAHCSDMYLVGHGDGETAGAGAVVFLGVDRAVIGPGAGVEDEGLPPHTAQDQAQEKEGHGEITGNFQESGGGACESFVDELLNQLHMNHLAVIIAR